MNEGSFGLVDLEYGTIVLDLEYGQEARICLEKSTPNAPFAITVGIYNLPFHTIFCDDKQAANQKTRVLKELNQQVINTLRHYRPDD